MVSDDPKLNKQNDYSSTKDCLFSEGKNGQNEPLENKHDLVVNKQLEDYYELKIGALAAKKWPGHLIVSEGPPVVPGAFDELIAAGKRVGTPNQIAATRAEWDAMTRDIDSGEVRVRVRFCPSCRSVYPAVIIRCPQCLPEPIDPRLRQWGRTVDGKPATQEISLDSLNWLTGVKTIDIPNPSENGLTRCPACSVLVKDGYPFEWCPECGNDLDGERKAKTCNQCGKALPATWPYTACPACQADYLLQEPNPLDEMARLDHINRSSLRFMLYSMLAIAVGYFAWLYFMG
jgi:hypothetical protein